MPTNEHERYKTTVQDEHWRNEEFQWVRILESADPAKGMVLLYIQKACTAFHEFAPAWNAGAVKAERIPFFRERLVQRIRQALVTMENNGLDTINGVDQLRGVLRSVESAKSGDDLAQLSETVHMVNHILLDALERE